MNGLYWALALLALLFGMVVVSAAVANPGGRARHARTPGQAPPPAAPQPGLPPGDPQAYGLAPGPWQVDTQDLTLHDAARGKDLPVRVYVPTPTPNARMGGGKLPVVVFSHGAGGDRRVGPDLLGHWASYGYVVIAPTHADSLALQKEAGQRPDIGKNIAGLGLNPQTRIDRAKDVSLCLDQLPEIERQVPALAGRLDAARIGVAGHSAGAMTAMLVGGVQGQRMPNMRDPRVKCAIVLSGQGVGAGLVFDQHAWDGFTLPALVATGSLDQSSRTGQSPQSRREPFDRAPAGDKYLLYIEGATHMSFTGKLAGSNMDRAVNRAVSDYLEPGGDVMDEALRYDQTAIFQTVQCATLAFLDAYVKDDPAAKAYLQGGNIAQLTRGVEWEKK
jgi:predicted dienelactone hydrolase